MFEAFVDLFDVDLPGCGDLIARKILLPANAVGWLHWGLRFGFHC
jgi:hypothetical protein